MLFTFGFANTQTIWTNETKLKGKIGTYEIEMTLAIPYGGANTCFTIGEYYYLSKKTTISLCSKDDERIIEYGDQGKETGYFILNDWEIEIGKSVVGTWHSMDGKKEYPVNLKVIGKGEY